MKFLTNCIFSLFCLFGLCAGENLVRNGDFSKVKHGALYPECQANGGEISLVTEDLTWNKCGKLRIKKIIKDPKGLEHVSAYVWIGGDVRKGGGFTVKPNTVYRFSVDLKGSRDGLRVNVCATNWMSAETWKNMKTTASSLGNVNLSKDWVTYKGTFKTGPQAKRAALGLQMWWNTKYGPQKYRSDDYVLFDNVKVIEQKNRLSALPSPNTQVKVSPTKAALASTIISAPQIDGHLIDSVWENAQELTDFVLLGGGTSSTAKTSVKVLADKNKIYLGIQCYEPLRVITSDTKSIWSGDVVEVFFAPRCNDRILSQFVIGSGGQRFASHGKNEINNYANWQAKTSRQAHGWTVEIAIPFSELGWKNPAKNGDLIGFNVARHRQSAHQNLTWSILKETFHDVAHFGELAIGDYAAVLQNEFNVKKNPKNRAEFEKAMAECRAIKIQSKFEHQRNKKFAVAPVDVTSDFAIPFLPDSIFNPPNKIELKTAINEIKALPIAIANLTNQVAEYRVILETVDKYDGEYGLKNFPIDQIIARQAVRFKDNDSQGNSLRFDPLPKMNEAFSITVPPKEAGVVWFDFDTTDVRPGIFTGRLRVIPLSEPAKFVKIKGSHHNRKYVGDMVDIPVSLEVRNIVLPKHTSRYFGFFSGIENESVFKLMVETGGQSFQIDPWQFKFGLDKHGNIDPNARQTWFPKLQKRISMHQALGKKYNFQPLYMINYSCYDVFTKIQKGVVNKETALKLWPQWVKAVKKAMNDCGISDHDYFLETWDEPHRVYDTILAAHRSAKIAAPTVQLYLTLGATIMPYEIMEKLNDYTDGWIFWRGRYFQPKYLKFIEECLKKNKKIFHYYCSTSIRENLDRYYRKHAWFGAYHNLTGNYLFVFAELMGKYGTTSWKVIPFGSLCYRSFGNYIPSIRYMALRQGMTDIKYLEKLQSVGANSLEAQKFLRTAIKRVMYTNYHNPGEADLVVEEAARLILKLQKDKQ